MEELTVANCYLRSPADVPAHELRSDSVCEPVRAVVKRKVCQCECKNFGTEP